MPSQRDGRVAGVVLAAGSSSRLGTNKLLIDVGGETLVRRAARRALGAGLAPVIAVVGFEHREVRRALDGLGLDLAVNPDHAAGMHTSLRTGLTRVPADCVAAVIILADMFLVTTAMIAALVTRYRAGSEPLVVSRYGGEHAPPTLYTRALFPALLGAGEGCGRHVVRRHLTAAATVAWPDGLLADLDRPEDLERLRALVPE
jgi:molybdenum cofactor cytidylyltransferase